MPRRPADSALRPFHPIVRKWFAETLGSPSAPQRAGWPAIAAGEHTLILAPTGTGKTLAAFLWELDALIREGEQLRRRGGELANLVHILYVSPLKALNNDVQRNLERPLAELRARFDAEGRRFPDVRVAVRTGDTPASARARMVRKSPHVLITTPESLHILLTSVRARTMLAGVRAVIVDEIHAVAGTKRGAHLALAMERLADLCVRAGNRPPQRIGLSATQRPLEEVAKFLGGSEAPRDARVPPGRDGMRDAVSESPVSSAEGHPGDPHPASPIPRPAPFRPVTVVDCGLVKEMEIAVASPVEDLGDVGGSVWPAVAALVLQHIRRARTTLVFVNNRAQAERIAARVNALASGGDVGGASAYAHGGGGERVEVAQPYHGSLSRERRLMLEERLKAGELKALVATSSLELGIDIGSVDLVLQLQSPKRVSAALQRVGRSGHALGAASRGVLVPTFRDDAAEILAVVDAMRAGDVEPTRVVQNALDVLAQTVVAMVAVDDWTADALYDFVCRAYPYAALPRPAFDGVLAMLAGKYPSEMAAELQARLSWDGATGQLAPLPGSRLTAVLNGGTIPDRGLYLVTLPDRTRLGELDEEFVHESRVGDVFQLGSSTWRVAAIEHDRVVVHPAPGAPARMPFWHGEFMARSPALAPRVGELRRALAAATTRAALRGIAERYGCDEATAQSLAEYVQQQRAVTGEVPDDRTLLLEHFRDETGAWRVVLHAPFGGRVSAPWGMALAARAREALGPNADVQVQTSDDGIMLRLPDLRGDPPLGALLGLTPSEAETRVAEAVGETSLFGARFRMNAARALLLPRGSARRRMPLWLQRLKALDLLDAVRELPDFPVLVETYRDVLQDAFDMPALREVLTGLAAGRLRVHVARTELPSPFAASLQFGFTIDWLYGDDTPRAERQAARLSVDRALLDDVMGAGGAGGGGEEDAELRRAIAQTVAERRGTAPGRRARTADELAVLLDRAGDLSPAELRERVATAEEGVRGDPVAELLGSGRAVAVGIAGAEEEPAVEVPVAEGPAAESKGARTAGDAARDNYYNHGGPPPDSESTAAERRGRHPQVASRGGSLRARAGGAPPQSQDTAGAGADRDQTVAWRIILTESYPRYAAALGDALLPRVRAGAELVERDAAEAVPAVLRRPVVTPEVARRELLARFVALAGPLTATRAAARYGWRTGWVQQWLEERHRAGKLVRGRFTPRAPNAESRAAAPVEWCSRRVVEIARRRALAALRRSIAAVPMSAYAAFLQRWQGLDPAERRRSGGGDGGRPLADVLRQLYGLPRPAAAWERDYLPARLDHYEPAELSRLMAAGEVVWAGVGRRDEATGALGLAQLRFVARGTGAVWAGSSAQQGADSNVAGDGGAAPAAALTDGARQVYDALARYGASFYADLQAATGLGGVGLREALRELVAAGLATSDAVESLREVARLRPLPPRGPAAPDPTRWLPAGFTPSPGRPVVHRRPSLRRLPKWKRPDREPPAAALAAGGLPPGAPWPGRWSRLDTPGVLGPPLPDEARAEAVARQWLARYGVVSRDWWRRERPPVAWRMIYHELRRLELRGEVRRGYFVRGLAGAQFALPEAVERLREPPDERAPWVVLAAGDPANPYALPRPAAGAAPDEGEEGGGGGAGPAERPRGAGALLVTRNGRVALGVEGRGRNVLVAPGLSPADAAGAARALAEFLMGGGGASGAPRRSDVIVRRIDGRAAVSSPHAGAFAEAGFRRAGTELRYYAGIGSAGR